MQINQIKDDTCTSNSPSRLRKHQSQPILSSRKEPDTKNSTGLLNLNLSEGSLNMMKDQDESGSMDPTSRSTFPTKDQDESGSMDPTSRSTFPTKDQDESGSMDPTSRSTFPMLSRLMRFGSVGFEKNRRTTWFAGQGTAEQQHASHQQSQSRTDDDAHRHSRPAHSRRLQSTCMQTGCVYLLHIAQ